MFSPALTLSWPAVGYTLLRSKWLLLLVALFGAAAAGVIGLVRTRAYAGDALVQVEPRQVPDRLVPSSVNSEWQERLASLGQQLLTAARLRQVIRQFQLFPAETRNMPSEDVLALMRRCTEIRLDRTWTHERPGAFHVIFEYRNPAVASQVANHLARALIELNRHDRQSSASGASDFLEQQVAQGRRELELQDARLSHYRRTHPGEIPGQEAVLVATLNRLQTQWQATQDRLVRLQQIRAALADSLYSAQMAPPAAVIPPDGTREHLRQQLLDLRSRYSERHPDVRLLQAEVSADPVIGPAPIPESPVRRARIATLQHQIQSALEEQARLMAQGPELLLRIAAYQSRLERLPLHEIAWNSLNSDHEIARQQYRALLEKRTAAQLSAELERRQKDESFRMLEDAVVPSRPKGLNWPGFALLGGLAGLLAGTALALCRDLCRNVIQGAWELPPHLELLGRVPHLAAPPSGIRRGPQARHRLHHWLANVAAAVRLLSSPARPQR